MLTGPGKAVILTSQELVPKYERLLQGQDTLESTLFSDFVEHLNSEIALETINSSESALNWSRSTFLHTRIQKNPSHYVSADRPSMVLSAQSKLEELVMTDVTRLHDNGLVTLVDRGRSIFPTGIHPINVLPN